MYVSLHIRDDNGQEMTGNDGHRANAREVKIYTATPLWLSFLFEHYDTYMIHKAKIWERKIDVEIRG